MLTKLLPQAQRDALSTVEAINEEGILYRTADADKGRLDAVRALMARGLIKHKKSGRMGGYIATSMIGKVECF